MPTKTDNHKLYPDPNRHLSRRVENEETTSDLPGKHPSKTRPCVIVIPAVLPFAGKTGDKAVFRGRRPRKAHQIEPFSQCTALQIVAESCIL